MLLRRRFVHRLINKIDRRISIASLTLIVSVFAMPQVLFAQKSNRARQQDERNENERVAKAEHSLSEAKKEFTSIQKELQSVSSRFEKSTYLLVQLKNKLRDAREFAEDRLGAKLGIPAALAKVRKAGAELQEIVSRIRDDVHTAPNWSQVEDDSEKAREAQVALLDDFEKDDAERDKKLKELQKRVLKPREIENEAVAKDPDAIEASKKLGIQQAELEKLRKLLPEGEVDKDEKVVQALKELAKQEKEHKEIQSTLGKTRVEATKIQKRFADAQLSLQRAKAADAADANRPKSKGK